MTDMSERARALEQALRMLRNECHAIMAMSYDAIKDSAGYTNLKVWIARVEEADALLADPPPSGASPQAETSEPSVMGAGCYRRVQRDEELIRFALSSAVNTLEEAGCACQPEEPCALCLCKEAVIHMLESNPAPVSPVEPTCACGKPAACRGAYDGAPEAFACDDCCGHGGEDGKCSPVEPEPPTGVR